MNNLDDAFTKFNRIDQPVPVLDDAKAPSMSIGDVVQIISGAPLVKWFAVTNIGFEAIVEPPKELLLWVADIPEEFSKSRA